MKILSQMVAQFQARHQKPPEQILVDPLALVVLSQRRSISPKWQGIPVACQEVQPPKAPLSGPARILAVGVVEGELRSYDLGN